MILAKNTQDRQKVKDNKARDIERHKCQEKIGDSYYKKVGGKLDLSRLDGGLFTEINNSRKDSQ